MDYNRKPKEADPTNVAGQYSDRVFTYQKAAAHMLQNERTTLYVDFGHLQQYDTDFATMVE